MSKKAPPPPTTCKGGIITRAWGDGGLDNSAAPNMGTPRDIGGVPGVSRMGIHSGGNKCAPCGVNAKRPKEGNP